MAVETPVLSVESLLSLHKSGAATVKVGMGLLCDKAVSFVFQGLYAGEDDRVWTNVKLCRTFDPEFSHLVMNVLYDIVNIERNVLVIAFNGDYHGAVDRANSKLADRLKGQINDTSGISPVRHLLKWSGRHLVVAHSDIERLRGYGPFDKIYIVAD